MNNESFEAQKNVSYSVHITEIDNETSEEKVVHDGLYHTVCMLAEDADNSSKMSELMMNENIMGLASMIAASHKHRIAARLALDVIDADRKQNFSMEDLLVEMLQSSEGGIQ